MKTNVPPWEEEENGENDQTKKVNKADMLYLLKNLSCEEQNLLQHTASVFRSGLYGVIFCSFSYLVKSWEDLRLYIIKQSFNEIQRWSINIQPNSKNVEAVSYASWVEESAA